LESLSSEDRKSLFALACHSTAQNSLIHLIQIDEQGQAHQKSANEVEGCLLNIKEHDGLLWGLCRDENATIKKIGLDKGASTQNVVQVQGNTSYFTITREGHALILEDCGETHSYDLSSGELKQTFGTVGDQLSILTSDPHSNRFVISDQCGFSIIDSLSKTPALVCQTPHQDTISALDFNPNSQNILMSASFDATIKFHDIRKLELPILTLYEGLPQIQAASFNPMHDQLIGFTGSNIYNRNSF